MCSTRSSESCKPVGRGVTSLVLDYLQIPIYKGYIGEKHSLTSRKLRSFNSLEKEIKRDSPSNMGFPHSCDLLDPSILARVSE